MVTPLGLGSPHRGCIPAPPRGAGLWQAGPPGGRGTRSRTGLRHPARKAGSCRASPGHLHVTEPCLLMPVPACPSPGPSPACWKYGWIIFGMNFVSSQNFPPL